MVILPPLPIASISNNKFSFAKSIPISSSISLATLALLFQPFFKIALGRELWNIVDVIVGVGLIISVFKT